MFLAQPDKAWLSTALAEMLTTELGAGEQLRTVTARKCGANESQPGIAGRRQLWPRNADKDSGKT